MKIENRCSRVLQRYRNICGAYSIARISDHLVDTAYLDVQLLVTSQETHGVNLVGRTRIGTGWQALQAKVGFAAENFVVDWLR